MIERFRTSRSSSALVTSPNLAATMRGGPLNIGLVSPYDYANQGGVTEHIKHLSQELRAQGHRVKVLAPFSTDMADVPPDVYDLGAVTQIPANGSVARISLSTDLRRTVRAI